MRRILAGAALALLVAAGSIAAAAWPAHHKTPTQGIATDVLGRAPATGSLHLLAFLATQPDYAATTSRSQAVEIVSLETQYGRKGLAAQIVDESGAGRGALINTYYDWQLGDIRVVADPARTLARRYGVTSTPAVVLVDARGTVVKRWDAYVPTVQVVQSITGKLTG
ncbi:hypothetical protein [Streptomyces sp. NPDC101455]|uniref:hypothetical protein n=1 Tax=Streptomyces sp. NPDC101455 TaxID=3366142 RepID=UPI0037FD065F